MSENQLNYNQERERLIKECPVRGECKMRPKKCGPTCPMYLQSQYLLDKSEIPKYLKDNPIQLWATAETRDAFLELDKFKKNIVQHVEDGRGLFIYGNQRGTGKTSWAVKIMKYYIFKEALRSMREDTALFISVPDLFDKMRMSMDNKEIAQEIMWLKERMKTIPILILDDIGAQNDSKWVREQLYIIINARYNELKSTIYTSNNSLKQLEKENSLGTRITRRIEGRCELVEVNFVYKGGK